MSRLRSFGSGEPEAGCGDIGRDPGLICGDCRSAPVQIPNCRYNFVRNKHCIFGTVGDMFVRLRRAHCINGMRVYRPEILVNPFASSVANIYAVTGINSFESNSLQRYFHTIIDGLPTSVLFLWLFGLGTRWNSRARTEATYRPNGGDQ